MGRVGRKESWRRGEVGETHKRTEGARRTRKALRKKRSWLCSLWSARVREIMEIAQ